MSENKHDLEQDLRRALRPLDPGPEFAARVVAALAHSRARSAARRRMLQRWAPVALAASIIAAVLIVRSDQQQLDARRGELAREQTIQALRIASRNLDSARRLALGD